MKINYKVKNKISFLALVLVLISTTQAQNKDEIQIRKIYDTALKDGKAYDWLNYLSNQIGGRLSGSIQAEQAVNYTKSQLDSLGLDRVWLQPVMVPKWVRGTPEFAYFETTPGVTTNVPITALGGSVATPQKGIKAKIIEVQGLEELEALGKEKIQGKIVFYNRPMDAKLINTFSAYSGAVDQRGRGAVAASKYGALGVIVRSMNLRLDDYPHTGAMGYGDLPEEERIPAAAISTNAADLLSTAVKLNPEILFYFKQNCKQFPDVQSFNGGFTPRGFSFDASPAAFEQVQSWAYLFKPYLANLFTQGGSGADIGPLKNDQIVLAGLRPDSQRYFDHHHAENDTFEHVNKRELELGAAAMTSLIYLFDTYGTVASKQK